MKMTWLYMFYGLFLFQLQAEPNRPQQVKTTVLLLLPLYFSCYVALLKPHKLYWTNQHESLIIKPQKAWCHGYKLIPEYYCGSQKIEVQTGVDTAQIFIQVWPISHFLSGSLRLRIQNWRYFGLRIQNL